MIFIAEDISLVNHIINRALMILVPVIGLLMAIILCATTLFIRKTLLPLYKLQSAFENQAAGVAEASAAVEEMIGNIGSVNKSVEFMAASFPRFAGRCGNRFFKAAGCKRAHSDD